MSLLGNILKGIFGKKTPKYTMKTYQDNSKSWQQRFQKIDNDSLPSKIKSELVIFNSLLDQTMTNLNLKDMEKIDEDIMPYLVVRLETSLLQNNKKTMEYCVSQLTLIMRDRTVGKLKMTPIEVDNMKQAYLEYEQLERQENELIKIENRLVAIDEKIEEGEELTQQEARLIEMEQTRLEAQKSNMLSLIDRFKKSEFKRSNDLAILARQAITELLNKGVTINEQAVEVARVESKMNLEQFDTAIEKDDASFVSDQVTIQGESMTDTTDYKTRLKTRKQKNASTDTTSSVKLKPKSKVKVDRAQSKAEEIEE